MVHLQTQSALPGPLRFEISCDANGKAFVVKKSTSENCTFEKEFPIGPTLTTKDFILNSLFTSYLRTRAMPTSLERNSVDQFQQSCEAEIAVLKSKLQETESNLLGLCHEVAQLSAAIVQRRNQMEAAQSLCAPIRSLPPEVLRLIFGMCFEENEYRMNSRNAPLLLCQVCKTWRDIVVSNPFFWRCPRFDVGYLHHNSISNCQKFLNIIAGRTREIPLVLEIRDTWNPSFTNSNSLLPNLLELFSLEFEKCIRLDLVVQCWTWYKHLLKLPVAESMLKKLEILSLCFKCQITPSNLSDFVLFKDAPKLTDVILDLRHPFNLVKIGLPYQRLCYLDCRFILRQAFPNALDEWKRVLEECSNLRSIKATFLAASLANNRSIVSDLPRRKVVLPSVTELTMIMGVNGNLDYLLSDLEFCNLDFLHFEAVQPCEIILDEDGISTCGSHISLTHLSWELSALSQLTLLRVCIAEEDFLPIFQSAPCLECLTISNLVYKETPRRWIDEDSRLVQLITEMTIDNPETLLPRLHFLHLYYPRQREDHQGTAASYGRLVRARSEMNSASGYKRLHYGPQFAFRLSFSKKHCTESIISSVLSAINKVTPAQCHTEITHEICDTFDWESPEPGSDEYNLMYQ